MLKRLPFLCAALLALAACSHDNGNSQPPASTATAPAAAPAATTVPATAATTNAATATSTATPAAASTSAQATPASNAPPSAPFVDNGKWVEGTDYTIIDPAQPKLTGTDKVEVVEAFSYGCPACNAYHPTMNELVKELPSNAVVAFLPASFMPQENWVTLQRAYLTAQSLGVAEKANDAMYDAVWTTRELSSEANGGGLKPKEALPTIDDIAKVYAKFGVDAKEFAAVANSFTINTKMKRADELMKAYGVQGTPTLIVDGKYRVEPLHFKDLSQSIELIKWLISKEAAGK